jgi:hypothetical protein
MLFARTNQKNSFLRIKEDRAIRKDLHAMSQNETVTGHQVLAAARRAEARGDHQGAQELYYWVLPYDKDVRHWAYHP